MNRLITTLLTLLLAVYPVCAQQKGEVKDVYVEIPYELEGGIPVVDVLIKGKAYKFVLDTGAPGIHVARKVVEQSSLKLRKKSSKVRDAHGVRKELQWAVVKDMKIGGISFSTAKALVSENDSYLFSCYSFDGIIGGEFLKRFVVKFDSRTKTVTLATDASRLVSPQQPWGKMKLFSSKTYCVVKVTEGGYDNFLFDSGSGMSSLDLDTARYNIYKQRNIFELTDEETGYGSTSVGLHGEKVYEKRYRATATEFSFGGYTFYNIPMATARTTKIGFVVTSYGDVILDYPRKRYCFIPHQEEANWSYIRIKAGCMSENSYLVISVVWDEELAKQVSVGDRIISIGNQLFENVDRCFRAKFHSLVEQYTTPDNDTIVLEKPNGERYTLSASELLAL